MNANETLRAVKNAAMSLVVAGALITGLGTLGCDRPGLDEATGMAAQVTGAGQRFGLDQFDALAQHIRPSLRSYLQHNKELEEPGDKP